MPNLLDKRFLIVSVKPYENAFREISVIPVTIKGITQEGKEASKVYLVVHEGRVKKVICQVDGKSLYVKKEDAKKVLLEMESAYKEAKIFNALDIVPCRFYKDFACVDGMDEKNTIVAI